MENPPAMMGQKSFTGSRRWFYCQIACHMKILGPEFGTSASTGESRERPRCCKPTASKTEKGGSLGFLVNQPRDPASSVLNNNLVSNNRMRAIEEDIQGQPLTSTHVHMCLHTCMYTHTHSHSCAHRVNEGSDDGCKFRNIVSKFLYPHWLLPLSV